MGALLCPDCFVADTRKPLYGFCIFLRIAKAFMNSLSVLLRQFAGKSVNDLWNLALTIFFHADCLRNLLSKFS